jgi:hypothetical protein
MRSKTWIRPAPAPALIVPTLVLAALMALVAAALVIARGA